MHPDHEIRHPLFFLPGASGTSEHSIDERADDISHQRAETRTHRLRQAERIVKRSRTILKEADQGDNAAVPVPSVDWGQGGPRNIVGIVFDREKQSMYKIAITQAVLKGRYARHQFHLCPERIPREEDIDTDKHVPLREV